MVSREIRSTQRVWQESHAAKMQSSITDFLDLALVQNATTNLQHDRNVRINGHSDGIDFFPKTFSTDVYSEAVRTLRRSLTSDVAVVLDIGAFSAVRIRKSSLALADCYLNFSDINQCPE